VAESYAPGAVVSEVARRHGISPQHLFVWRKAARAGVLSLPADEAPPIVLVVTELRSAGPRREDRKDPAGARKRADKRRADRGALPAHLPHIDVTIAPEDTNCPCCRAPMHVIGEETSKRLDVVPAQFCVIVTHRPKYACRACTDGVVQAPAVQRLIKGGLPTEAMVAYVHVAKYARHLPLYRQAQMLRAQGIDIKRAVLAFWVGYAAACRPGRVPRWLLKLWHCSL
jgi:transposase